MKPKLRGVFHEIAFYVSLVTGPLLIAVSPADARLGVGIYSASLSSMFGASALYHRPTWRQDVRKWLRKLDHSMIFVFIAGTFTPIAYVLRDDPWMRYMLIVVWVAAAIGMAIQFLPFNMPKSVTVIPYLVLGWMGPTLLPETYRTMGITPIVFLAIGGALYTVGAIMYARQRPNLKQGVFGYHEFFHLFVIGAAVAHYIAVMLGVRLAG